MPCVILETPTKGSVFPGQSFGISLTTIPVLCRCTWSGDFESPVSLSLDGRQMLTRWDTPGVKVITAECDGASKSFAVVVQACEVVYLESDHFFVVRGQRVTITAITSPADTSHTAEHPERHLHWNGDLGPVPNPVSNAFKLFWDTTGAKQINVTCGSGSTATIFIFVSLTEEDVLKQAEEARANAKRAHAETAARMENLAEICAILTAHAVIGDKEEEVQRVIIISYVFWLFAKRARALASDPPRHDIDVVSRCEDLTFDLPPPAGDTQASFQELLKKSASIAVCMDHLVKSIERVDGALSAALDSDELLSAPGLAAQASAVSHNAAICADLTLEVLSMTEAVNEAWLTMVNMLKEASVDLRSVPLEEIANRVKALWNERQPLVRSQLGLSEPDMVDLTQAVEAGIQRLESVRRLPEVLFDDDAVTEFADMSLGLQELASAYGRLVV